MKILIITKTNCPPCLKVKDDFRTLKIPFTAKGITQEYIDSHPHEMAKYKGFPHVYRDGEFWFYGAPPINTISRVLARTQNKINPRR
jgi:hypothetical protein